MLALGPLWLYTVLMAFKCFEGSTYASVVPPHFCYKSFLRSVISDHPELDPALVVEGLILNMR